MLAIDPHPTLFPADASSKTSRWMPKATIRMRHSRRISYRCRKATAPPAPQRPTWSGRHLAHRHQPEENTTRRFASFSRSAVRCACSFHPRQRPGWFFPVRLASAGEGLAKIDMSASTAHIHFSFSCPDRKRTMGYSCCCTGFKTRVSTSSLPTFFSTTRLSTSTSRSRAILRASCLSVPPSCALSRICSKAASLSC